LTAPTHTYIREPPQAIEKNNTYVVQKYIKHPALIDGHKFDFRIYVLITSVVDPLTIFLYDDGLVRLASEKYTLNLQKMGGNSAQDHFMHLTNYSLNKKNQKNFDGIKHKLSLAEMLDEGMSSEHPEKGTFTKTAEQIWAEIEDIVIKTVITVQPQLQHYYRSCQPREPDLCYELLGFDIMLDRKLKPWLLEVNHLPSFNHDTPVD
jgi:tubulin polyglutamylase TTLL6/13